MQQHVFQQHFEQMPQDHRQQAPPGYQQQMDPTNSPAMVQGMQQMGQQQPGLLESMMGRLSCSGSGGGATGSGMMGLAGTIAKHMLGGQGGGL